MKKAIVLQTQNQNKLQEYSNIFKKYDIVVLSSSKHSLFENEVDASLSEFNSSEYNIIALMADESNLYSLDGKLSSREDMDIVQNKTTFKYLLKDSNEIITKYDFIDGWIDLTQKHPQAFSWDDIFIVKSTGLSYFKLSQQGLKISPRNRLVANFIKETIYYKEHLDLNFNKQNQERSVVFDNRVLEFVKTNKYLSLPLVQMYFGSIFNQAMSMGAFFRSAKNRREKNYWLPGLNAGLPLVGKKDEIHEITFAVHDLCHFVMPDLIFDITDHENTYKKTYIIHRMMSEAITMVYADMIFIDCLVQSGVDYDFSARRIYPLYQAIIKKNPDIEIENIVYANVQYCLFGDESFYLNLLDKKDIFVFESFKEKFEPFFVEDYKWTDHNFNNMNANRHVLFSKWTKDARNIIQKEKLVYLSEFHRIVGDNDVRKIADKTFSFVMKNYFQKKIESLSEEQYISSSFKKYMLGQVFVFYKFSFLSISKPYLNKILTSLEKDILTIDDIVKIRAFYENFLILLKDELFLIDEDDYQTYKEVFPIFDSFYVFYDKEKTYYKDLKEISKEILS